MLIHKGCKQGAPESPQLWNAMLDKALMHLRLITDPHGRVPQNHGDRAGRLTHPFMPTTSFWFAKAEKESAEQTDEKMTTRP